MVTNLVRVTGRRHVRPGQSWPAAGPDRHSAIRDLKDNLKFLLNHKPGPHATMYTPAMVCSKGAAMPQNRMRCAAIKSSTCSIFCYGFWNISAIYYPIFKRFSVS